jgi:hypothetical protein
MALLSEMAFAPLANADSVKPLSYGPFFMNQLSSTLSPTGYEYVMDNALYHFQVGWMEPLSMGSQGLFRETYLETSGNLNISPFLSDIGTTFNLKPIRYLEVGLSYNRLLFHNTMVTFDRTESKPFPNLEEWRPANIIARQKKEPGGADVFTFQTNLTVDIGPAQLYLFGSRTLWDIDAQGNDFVYEYDTDILLRTRDRVNSVLAQLSWDLRPHSLYSRVSFSGLSLRSQYWYTTQTRLEKNLVSGGITGFRFGRNPERQRRGLDLSVGYWTLHEQLPADDWVKSLVLMGDWKWNIQFLKI